MGTFRRRASVLCGDTPNRAATEGFDTGIRTVRIKSIQTEPDLPTIYVSPLADGFSTMLMSGNTLYGTMAGAFGQVFALSVGPIPLNVARSGANMVLTCAR